MLLTKSYSKVKIQKVTHEFISNILKSPVIGHI